MNGICALCLEIDPGNCETPRQAGSEKRFLLKGPLTTQVTVSNFALSENCILCGSNLVPLRC